MKPHKTALFTILLIFSLCSLAETYTYTGPNFVDVYGSYSTSNQISVTFELPQAVPPNTPMTDYTGEVISWSFSDGQQILDENNAYIPYFRFSTNASGQPDEWLLSAYEIILARGAMPLSVIETAFSIDVLQQDFGSQDFNCLEFNGPNGWCSSGFSDNIDSGHYFSIAPASAVGDWTGGQGGTPQAATPVPANSLWAMLLLGALFLTFTYYRSQKIK